MLFWLNILAARRMPVADLVREHWPTYGRNYYSRHDYEESDLRRPCPDDALRDAAKTFPGKISAASRSRRPTTSPITIRSTARTRPIRA